LEGNLISVFFISNIRYRIGKTIALHIREKYSITHGNFPVKIVLAFLRGSADLQGAVIYAAGETAGVSGG
jgi:hypothetical protein